MKIEQRFLDTLDTPLGPFAVVADSNGRLKAAGFVSGYQRMENQLRRYRETELFQLITATNPGGCSVALRDYFGGARTALDKLDLAPEGTPFQQDVWLALCTIPYGKTSSYGKIAKLIGRPKAVRAVGAANGANPIAVVVPCHRVIGADGSLTGYAGGLDRKRWLLQHEGVAVGPEQLPLLQ